MNKLLFFLLTSLFFLNACGDDEMMTDDDMPINNEDLLHIPHNPQTYTIEIPDFFNEMPIPADNPMTVEGVSLGRHLFYDPILSADSTQSCATCHQPAGSFTDNLDVSVGIDGLAGTRSSMSLLNVGYFDEGLFWDGRVQTLEEQALLPVEDVIELHNTWPDVIEKFKIHPTYPEMFRKAFNIADRDEITKELAAKAIAQFERTLVSSGQSKFHRAKTPGVFLSDDELNGRDLFFFEVSQTDEHPGCSHPQCHSNTNDLFTSNAYTNNGLDEADDFNDFEDFGRGAITGIPVDNGKFRVPSLHNIALTAPYMHDGRFQTLEEVLDHYSSGGHSSPNINANIQAFTLTDQQKTELLAFLHALTDTVFTNNPAHQNPFE